MSEITATENFDKNEIYGQEYIQRNWSNFRQSTRDWISATGRYSENGRFLLPQREDSNEVLRNLEVALGQLKRCIDATLPFDGENGAPIPLEACKSEVMDSAREILHGSYAHEPSFLRLAIAAVRQYELAQLLGRLPGRNRNSTTESIFRLGFGIAALLGLLASPAMLGYAFNNIVHGDVGSAIQWLYAIGAVALVIAILKNASDEKQKTPDEIAYFGWLRLSHFGVGSWLDTGVGASAYLNQMMSKGAVVPPIALDLCALLTHRMSDHQK